RIKRVAAQPVQRFSARTLGLLAPPSIISKRDDAEGHGHLLHGGEGRGAGGRRGAEDGGVPFYVNRGGLPVDEETWERMWRHVARIHPQGEAVGGGIRGPRICPRYNHTGTQFFEIKKSRPLTALMDIAKEMTREVLPIKCLEAVILSIYLTTNLPGVERFPLSFKTQFSGNHFYHIRGRFGALGISRRDDLMFKHLEFRTLDDLVQEFEGAYRGYSHTLRKVKIGQYVSHDVHSVEQIDWKHSVLDVDRLPKEELRRELERHTRDMRL
ncbi:hypothetical protein CRUP_027375, partial [Coryphaenoides rupestris]